MMDIYEESKKIDWESKEVKDFMKHLRHNRVNELHKVLILRTPNSITMIDDTKCNCFSCNRKRAERYNKFRNN
jgi:hypothetical protein